MSIPALKWRYRTLRHENKLARALDKLNLPRYPYYMETNEIKNELSKGGVIVRNNNQLNARLMTAGPSCRYINVTNKQLCELAGFVTYIPGARYSEYRA